VASPQPESFINLLTESKSDVGLTQRALDVREDLTAAGPGPWASPRRS